MPDTDTGLQVKELEGDTRWQEICQTLSEIRQAQTQNEEKVAAALAEVKDLQAKLFEEKQPRKVEQAGLDYVVEDPEKIELAKGPVKVDPKTARYIQAGVTSPAAHTLYKHLVGRPAHGEDRIKRLHELNDMMFVTTEICRSAVPGFQPWHVEGAWDEWTRLLRDMPETKALYATSSTGSGVDLVPTLMSSTLMSDVMTATKVAGLFPVVNMPSNPFTVPVQLNSTSLPKKLGEPTGDAETKIGTLTQTTRKITFTAVNLGFRTLWSEDLNADSIVAVWDSLVRPWMIQVQANGLDSAIINGDTTATHQDTNVTASDDCRKAWIGLRKASLVNTTSGSASLATFNETNLRALRKLLGRYAADPKQLAYIPSLSAHIQMLNASNFPSFLTLEKIGPQAAVLTGQLGSFDGSPVIASEFLPENLNATGTYDGATMTKTGILVVNHRSWALGRRQELAIRVREDPDDTDQWVAVTKQRADYQAVVSYTSNILVAFGYNIAS